MNKPALNSSIFKDEVNNTGIVLEDTKFPISVFPKKIQEIILDLNDNMGFSVDNTSASMLFAFSTAIGNSYKLEFKRDWIESALVYIAIIGDAGDNKTHPMEWVLEPIKQRDKKSQSTYVLDKSHYDSVIIDETILDKPEMPVESRILINNVTIEKIPAIHSENTKGLGYYSEELMQFLGNLNKYNGGDDFPYWLSNWSNKGYRVDRVKSNQPLAYFEQYVSILGATQGEMTYKMLKGDSKHNGFFERWLYSIPLKSEFAYEDDNEIRVKTIGDWCEIIEKVLDIPYDENNETKILKMSPDAKKNYLDWQNKNTDIIRQRNSKILAKVQKKMQTYCKKFSLILEIISWSCDESNLSEINSKSVAGAIKLTEYFRENTLKIYQNFEKESKTDNYKKELLFDSLPETFKTVEAIKIGKEFDIEKRSVHSYLKDSSKYEKIRHGQYKRVA
tara:strand:- start:192 stop:1532 length:1341 start_codon:yes stop_codon:yes gene_type:complete